MIHECHEFCLCPLDGGLTRYHEPTGQHACVNKSCDNHLGFILPSLAARLSDLFPDAPHWQMRRAAEYLTGMSEGETQ